jgi:putative membrane protein insertion efficiency factor
VTVIPALFLIRFYQTTISPGLGPRCRFEPSCSHFAYEAFERHGLIKGFRLTVRRLTSCRPFGRRGYDPVPD